RPKGPRHPDIHQGYGVPIGSVLGLHNAIMPAAVGYDINCGMRLLNTQLTPDQCDTTAIARSVARDIPLGEGKSNLTLNTEQLELILRHGLPALEHLPQNSDHRAWEAFDPDQHQADLQRVEMGGALPGRTEHLPDIAWEKGTKQLGTLGGGNHFIEFQLVQKIFDTALAQRFGIKENHITVMIHSGSRGFGHRVADKFMNQAADLMHLTGYQRQLAYLTHEQPEFDQYIGAMNAAGNFAYANRHIMTLLVRRCLRRMFAGLEVPLIYDVSHNMAQLEQHTLGKETLNLWVHRKGATRAFGPRRMADTPFKDIGQPVIIPGSMGTGSYLLIGIDSSEETLCSVNHGAGRVMSRTAAAGKIKKGKIIKPAAISDERFRLTMRGVTLIAENKAAIKEEAPDAYKDIDEVIRVVEQAKLARPVARLKPLAVLKG
ncbi:MAG: RtcB family protein, partial [Planctomycetes bacterium]|nr:RtcB family protein [Planctomycetota bacterium]